MADKEDKWAAYRSKQPQGDAYQRTQDHVKEYAKDNPLANAYAWLMKKKPKDQADEQ